MKKLVEDVRTSDDEEGRAAGRAVLVADIGRVLAGVALRAVVHLQADYVVDEARQIGLCVVAADGGLDVRVGGPELVVVQIPDGVERIGTVYCTPKVGGSALLDAHVLDLVGEIRRHILGDQRHLGALVDRLHAGAVLVEQAAERGLAPELLAAARVQEARALQVAAAAVLACACGSGGGGGQVVALAEEGRVGAEAVGSGRNVRVGETGRPVGEF